jgi:hypothetical protein
MNPIISHSISYILGAVSLAISPIFKNLIYKKTDEKCIYLPPKSPDKSKNYKSFDVKATTYFNKVTHISCRRWSPLFGQILRYFKVEGPRGFGAM